MMMKARPFLITMITKSLKRKATKSLIKISNPLIQICKINLKNSQHILSSIVI